MPKQAKKHREIGRQTNLYLHRAAIQAILDLAEEQDWTMSRAADWLLVRGIRAERRCQAMARMRAKRMDSNRREGMTADGSNV